MPPADAAQTPDPRARTSARATRSRAHGQGRRQAGHRPARACVNPQGWKKSTAQFGAGWQASTPLAGAAVVVDGLNIAKRHTKPRASAGRTDRQPRVQQGGILDIADADQRQQRHGHLPGVRRAHADPPRARPTAAASGSARTAASP